MAILPRLSTLLSLGLLLASAGLTQGAAQLCHRYSENTRVDVSSCKKRSRKYDHIQAPEAGHNPRMRGGQEVAIWEEDQQYNTPHYHGGPYGPAVAYKYCNFPLPETPANGVHTYYWVDSQGHKPCRPTSCNATACVNGVNCILDPNTKPPQCGCETADGVFHTGWHWTRCEGH